MSIVLVENGEIVREISKKDNKHSVGEETYYGVYNMDEEVLKDLGLYVSRDRRDYDVIPEGFYEYFSGYAFEEGTVYRDYKLAKYEEPEEVETESFNDKLDKLEKEKDMLMLSLFELSVIVSELKLKSEE